MSKKPSKKTNLFTIGAIEKKVEQKEDKKILFDTKEQIVPQNVLLTDTDDDLKKPKKRGRPRKNLSNIKPPEIDINLLLNSDVQKEKEKKAEIILHFPNFDNITTDKMPKKFFDSDNNDTVKTETKSETKFKVVKSKIITEDMFNTVKTYPNDLKLIDMTTKKPIIKEKTDIVCWHDTEPFDTLPCFAVDKCMMATIFYVFGCFCSFNCALSYIMNMNDGKISIRIALIKKLYSIVFPKAPPLVMSPQREMLKKFGGTLTIKEFRDKNILLTKEFTMSIPPLYPLLPIIEETQRDVIEIKKTI